ncbi:hypothetical protein PMAYCL1PPCAC_13144, partial [Pristionchus mayeri]
NEEVVWQEDPVSITSEWRKLPRTHSSPAIRSLPDVLEKDKPTDKTLQAHQPRKRKSRWGPVQPHSLERSTSDDDEIGAQVVAEAKQRMDEMLLLQHMQQAAMERDAESREESIHKSHQNGRQQQPNHQELELIHLNEGYVTCVFCNALDHPSVSCHVYNTWELRTQIRDIKKLCWHCLGHFRQGCKQRLHRKRCT